MIATESSPIRAVVFDMDGVLIDSHPAHKAAWGEFLRSMGREVSDAELDFILDGRTRPEILRHYFGDLPDHELHRYGRCKDEIFRAMERDIKPVPGVVEFLGQLQAQSIRASVATSASEIRTVSTVERLGLGGYFEAIVTASDVSAGKPDPTVYRLACERMEIRPEDAVAFDDAIAGIEAAKSAGMRCIGVTNNGASRQLIAAGAETVIVNFCDFSLENIASIGGVKHK